MNTQKPFIHPFKTPGGYYFFDVNKNSIAKITQEIYQYLINEQVGKQLENNDISAAAIDKLQKDGFLSSRRVKEIVHPFDESLHSYLNNKVHMIILQVTQQCNFRCKYCTYSGNYENRVHSEKKMNIDIAKKSIDFLKNHSSEVDEVSIGFYGGEPLLEISLIENSIRYANEKFEGKKVRFNLTTNGTILTDDIIKFFIEHDVGIMISLDGPKDIHDKNRRFAVNGCGTFDSIIRNLTRIRQKYPEYMKNIQFNAVLDPTNDFSCISDFFMDFDLVNDSLLMSTITNDKYAKKEIEVSKNFMVQYNFEYFKLFLSNLGRIDKNNTSKILRTYFERFRKRYHEERLPLSGLPDKCHHSGPCIPGSQRLFVNVNGDLYPCERVSESSDLMKIGHIDTGFDIDKARNILNIGKISEHLCKNCWAILFCDLCAASADEMSCLSLEKKSNSCKRVRQSVENYLKDYCMLLEHGYKFDILLGK